MTNVNPHATTMVSLLLLLPRERGAEAWKLLSATSNQYDLAQFLKPLLERAASGHRSSSRALAYEVLNEFSDLDEATLVEIGDVLVPYSRSAGIGRLWACELTNAALRVAHELLPETLEQRLAQW